MKLIGEIEGPIIDGRIGLFMGLSALRIIRNEVHPPSIRPHHRNPATTTP